MKLRKVELKNFRRLEKAGISFEEDTTVFVGPNNSGKTSATHAFRLFLESSDFKIHDFSASKICEFDKFPENYQKEGFELPTMSMDLWFSVDPDVEFGRVSALIPNISKELNEVGIRIVYGVKDPKKLIEDFKIKVPKDEKTGEPKKNLTQFLSIKNNISKHFDLSYFSLYVEGEKIESPEGIEEGSDIETDEPTETKQFSIKPEEGKAVLKSLLRIDFVDAQRNIDDYEMSRSNKLSAAFAAFYKKNLEQPEVNDEANSVIEVNNANLTQHYETHFQQLMAVIKGLGIPSVNDRQLRIISSLDAAEALRGSTDLLYFDSDLNHELPEAYNGLGFKNLVYMAIQVSHYHLQWARTLENRPLCQVIFIEEPEVHLHAQVQQTFIKNMWDILKESDPANGMAPQLGITTHSSHILDAIEFSKIRYFKRCLSSAAASTSSILNSSTVQNLREFKPNKKSASGVVENKEETSRFLKQYLSLVHCDLFFADAAILVEGTVEKLLLPQMITKVSPRLKQNYLTILEVGGAYAHRFASLIEFLGIPYLVITDIDSVDPTKNRTACPAITSGSTSSNAAIKFYFDKDVVTDLAAIKNQRLYDNSCFVTYQKPLKIHLEREEIEVHGRTFEETFIYENLESFLGDEPKLKSELEKKASPQEQCEAVYNYVSSENFKKTEFALNIFADDWSTPQYITDGLKWLEEKINPQSTTKTATAKKVKK